MEPRCASHFEYDTHNPVFDSGRMNQNLELDSDGSRVRDPGTTTGAKPIYARTGLTHGRHFFCFEIVNRGGNAHINIGVSAGAVKTDNGQYAGIGGADGVSLYLNNEHRYWNGSNASIKPWDAPDNLVRNARYIGVLLDLVHRHVIFFADGECLGVSVVGDIISENKTWFPVVTLSESGQEVRVASLAPRPSGAYSRAGTIPKSVLDSGRPVTVHSILMDPARKSDRFSITPNNMVLRQGGSSYSACIVGTEGFSAGRHYWSWTCPYLSTTGEISFGVTDNVSDLSAEQWGGSRNNTGASLQISNQNRYHDVDKATSMLPPGLIKRARTVGILLDMEQKTMTAYVNGLPIGALGEGGHGTVLRGGTYYPCVTVRQFGPLLIPDALSVPRGYHSRPNGALRPLEPSPMPAPVAFEEDVQVFQPRFDVCRLKTGLTLSHGNRAASYVAESTHWRQVVAEDALPATGKSFFSILITRPENRNMVIGVCESDSRGGPYRGLTTANTYPGSSECPGVGLHVGEGKRYFSSTNQPVTNDQLAKAAVRIGVLVDMDARTVHFYGDGDLICFGAGPDTLNGKQYYPCVGLGPGQTVFFEEVAPPL